MGFFSLVETGLEGKLWVRKGRSVVQGDLRYICHTILVISPSKKYGWFYTGFHHNKQIISVGTGNVYWTVGYIQIERRVNHTGTHTHTHTHIYIYIYIYTILTLSLPNKEILGVSILISFLKARNSLIFHIFDKLHLWSFLLLLLFSLHSPQLVFFLFLFFFFFFVTAALWSVFFFSILSFLFSSSCGSTGLVSWAGKSDNKNILFIWFHFAY